MRQVFMNAPGDVSVGERDDPKIVEPTDVIIRLTATCICGSDLWPYRGVEEVDHTPMGHEYVGVVEEIGDEVETLKVGDFVVGSFVISDNTCEICQTGYQSRCVHAEFVSATIGTQAEKARIPFADGTLVATPGKPDEDLIPSLLAASDVLGTGWFAATAAEAGPGKTVAVVGDGAVGLMGVLAAKQLGAERIIAMSRHADRQELAREFGATDIVVERGDEGGENQGTHRRARRALGHRGGRNPGIVPASPRCHPTRRAHRLCRRRPRRRLDSGGCAVLRRGAPARRPGSGASFPAGVDPADLGPEDQPGQGVRPHLAARSGR
jgi:threonine dehydrogenase-like Zn-dependent dehydrogenase